MNGSICTKQGLAPNLIEYRIFKNPNMQLKVFLFLRTRHFKLLHSAHGASSYIIGLPKLAEEGELTPTFAIGHLPSESLTADERRLRDSATARSKK